MHDEQPGATTPLRTAATALDDRSASPGRFLFGLLVADIAAGTANLPSPRPRIAQRVDRGVRAATHGRRISRLLAADPALSAKALRAAGGQLGARRPRTLPDIVQQLDRAYLSGLISGAVDNNPQVTDGALRTAGRNAWLQSVRVSAIAYLLATLDGRFDPEEAALAGLLHNVGVLALLGRAAREDRPGITAELSDACRYYGGEAGRELARAWGFGSTLSRVAGSYHDWYRDHDGPADLADLVLVAQLHACLGQHGKVSLPVLCHMPAFAKLDLGRASPRFSLGLLEAANNALALTERQLAAL